MTMFGKEVKVTVTVFYVAEVVGKDSKGNDILAKRTRDYNTREQALAHKRRMGYGNYKIRYSTKEI